MTGPTATTSKILWAEDNPQDRMLIQDAVDGLATRPGLTFVPDGVVLLKALQDARPDHVILDLNMPRLGGIEAIRRIRAHPELQALPVTVFSSSTRPDEIEQCQALGVSEVVQKPVDFNLFSSEVQRIVARRP